MSVEERERLERLGEAETRRLASARREQADVDRQPAASERAERDG